MSIVKNQVRNILFKKTNRAIGDLQASWSEAIPIALLWLAMVR